MGKIILIAEDTDDTRSYMVLLMQSKDYEVYEATNGLEAIEIARQQHPNLILMDISMPEMDGLSETQIIRSSIDEISKVPIVALTAFGNDYRERAMEAGCND
ncbi:MAG TPA: response regulator, partial [Pyrinomonadaceae bacterium]|nr:response regulator [Pyrinomonadaceae bacterium]